MRASMPVETVNKVLSYLATQQYSMVAELINEIQAQTKVEDQPLDTAVAVEEDVAE